MHIRASHCPFRFRVVATKPPVGVRPGNIARFIFEAGDRVTAFKTTRYGAINGRKKHRRFAYWVDSKVSKGAQCEQADRKSRLKQPEKDVCPSQYRPTLVRMVLCCVIVFMATVSMPGISYALGSAAAGASADWRYYIAGCIAAGLSHGISTPIDVVKTRMQTNPELYRGSMTYAFSRIVQSEGALFLLQGFGPTLLGYGIEGALKFGCYEYFKLVFCMFIPNTFVCYLSASIVAGAAASVVLCPAELVRIRLVADPNFASNPIEASIRLIREEGLFSSFAGLPVMLSKQIPYTMAKQVSFDYFCQSLRALFNLYVPDWASSIFTRNLPVCLGAFGASALSCLFSHPGDTLLTEFYKDQQKRGPFSLCAKIVKEDGFQGLWKGFSARVFHVVAIVTIQLITYDFVKQMIGLQATGT